VSDTPLMAIQVGDSISPSSWEPGDGPQDEVVVTKISHLFTRHGEPAHIMSVFTRLPEDHERTGQ
jgi:hypothetical protein